MMLVLSPLDLELRSLWDLQRMTKYCKNVVGGVPCEADHPMIKEIRRRLIGGVKDLEEFGFL